MWLPNCLTPTYPQCTWVNTELFGIPQGHRGRCDFGIRGVVIHCLHEPMETYTQGRCKLPRNYRQRGREHHDSMHWLIDADGNLICMVSEEDVAWGWGELDSPNDCLPNPNWPPLVGLHPNEYDCALIHVGIELPPTNAFYGCPDVSCDNPTPYRFNQTLVRLLAAIAVKYHFTNDTNYFQLDTNLRNCSEECECVDVCKLMCAVGNYCERPTLFTQEDYPEMPPGEQLEWVLGITNTGRIVRVRRNSL